MKRNSWLVTNALRSVSATFRTNPVESAALLRQAIEPKHLAEYGYEEMHWLSRDLEEIESIDPELVADIYAAVFAHNESSTETTEMSGSQILPLRSHRRQDYNHAEWQLAQNYPRFLERAPVAASRALVRVIDSYVAEEHRSVSSTPTIETFEVDGNEASFSHDYSYIWGDGASGHDDAVQILNAFFRYLEEMLQQPGRAQTVDQILALLFREGKQAIIWARLLRLGAHYPAEFGLRLRSLAWTVPVLRSMDTEIEASDFVAAIFPLLSSSEREKVENSILSLPAGAEGDGQREIARPDQARLLGRLNRNDLVTEGAKRLVEELQAANAIPAPVSRRPRFQVSAVEMTETRWVQDVLGVSAEKEGHKRFLELRRPVEQFQSRHTNSTPTAEEAEAVLPQMEALRAALQNPGDDVDTKLVNMGCGTLSAACAVAAKIDTLSCETHLGRFVRSLLLQMSQHPEPEHDPKYDAGFDEHPGWGSPLPRIEAAEGLMALARQRSCCDAEVLDAIERLGSDPAPQVRFQVAIRLTYLYQTAPERMWKYLDERIEAETSNAVLNGLAQCLQQLAGPHSDRSVELSARLFQRIGDGPGAKHPKATCIHILVGLYIWHDHRASKELLDKLVPDVCANQRELSVVLSSLRATLTHSTIEPPTAENSGIRGRSVELFHTISGVVCEEFDNLIARSDSPEWSESDAEKLKGIAHLIDHADSELFFASGVFRNGGQQQPTVSSPQHERFYRELSSTIDRLSAVGIPSGVHHLIEMLEAFILIDPKRVFFQVSTLVKSGRSGRYQYESMAAEHIVRIVERYLAEYRPLLQEDAECRVALRKTLDAFVEAGWPAAQQLSYRLDEIFR